MNKIKEAQNNAKYFAKGLNLNGRKFADDFKHFPFEYGKMSWEETEEALLHMQYNSDDLQLLIDKYKTDKPYKLKEYLTEEYIKNKRTTSDIAKDFDIAPTLIAFFLRKNGIKTRKKGGKNNPRGGGSYMRKLTKKAI